MGKKLCNICVGFRAKFRLEGEEKSKRLWGRITWEMKLRVKWTRNGNESETGI